MGNSEVTRIKTAAKNESQFLVTKTADNDDGFNGKLTAAFGNDIVEAEVVGQINNTEEEVVIKVNNKVTTCDVDIEICCEIVKDASPPEPPVDPPGLLVDLPLSPPPPSAPKCGVRNEDG